MKERTDSFSLTRDRSRFMGSDRKRTRHILRWNGKLEGMVFVQHNLVWRSYGNRYV